MAMNFQFHICTAKTFLKALNVLFTVVCILTETTRHYTRNASSKNLVQT